MWLDWEIHMQSLIQLFHLVEDKDTASELTA